MEYQNKGEYNIIITIYQSIIILIGLIIITILDNQLKYFTILQPQGTPTLIYPQIIPLEFLAYFTRIISLGLRLAINLITGHILVKVILSFIYWNNLLPFLFLSLFFVLEFLISYLQAFIFIFIFSFSCIDLLAALLALLLILYSLALLY